MELMGGRSRVTSKSVGCMLRILGLWWLMCLLCGMNKWAIMEFCVSMSRTRLIGNE